MPCYQVNILSVEFKARNRELLKRAINAIDYDAVEVGENIIRVVGRARSHGRNVTGTRIEINLETGLARMTDAKTNQDLLNELKRSYSRTTIEELARKKKWIARAKSSNEITLTRY